MRITIKHKRYASLIMALTFSSTALSMDIKSYTGSSNVTPIGVPIFANGNNGQPLQKYNQNGTVNNYAWIDQKNRVLSRNLVFTPKNQHNGRRVKLCKVNSTSMNCSNTLRVISSGNRNVRSVISPFNINWDYNSQFDENVILMSATSFSTTTSFTYSGQTANGPMPIGLIPRITDQNGIDLISMHLSLSASYADFDVSFDAPVNLGPQTQIINFCPDLLVTDTFPPTISSNSKCISKLLRDGDIENSNSTYFYPPSPAQFNALFPHVNFIQTENVTSNSQSKSFVLAPRIDDSGNNLLEQYCSAIGNNIVPLNQSEMEIFANSNDFTPGDFWPGTTGYWTNQNDLNHPWASLIPGGMGVVGGLTLPSGNPEFSSGSNSYYRGFYVCKAI